MSKPKRRSWRISLEEGQPAGGRREFRPAASRGDGIAANALAAKPTPTPTERSERPFQELIRTRVVGVLHDREQKRACM
ncbi:MAG: hypothetical protein JXR37_30390 [Kiritimatiellae bacterium]|nr:hypothetical protein [Kiritimatiellia bacterium]